ncbi:MAG: GTPase Era [Anaerolineae bacterium]|nr:GTPase Era [Anaerolineae bacterium]
MEKDIKPEAIKNTEAPEPNAESEALIAQFLQSTGGEDLPETDWHEEQLPTGHRSGFVALIGRPNVGKSTLLNAIIGEKVAIVSRKPQTTRTRINGILTEPEYQLIFTDTPGIHKKPTYQLNKKMIDLAVTSIPDADVILFVVDVSLRPRDEDEHIGRLLRQKVSKRPVIFVLNKLDKLPLEIAKERIESYWKLLPDYAYSIPVSALKGTNIDTLLAHILDYIPEGVRYYPDNQITDQTQRQIAAELIREAMLRKTYQEIPHAAAVLIEDFKERDNGSIYIAARIWVERESQKPIIIGKGGSMLKQIGTAARKELERFIGGQVYLDLWVKVQPQWRDREARLRELGFK